jgi:5-methyltetrahydrofolate--homocysteine methyltransferase
VRYPLLELANYIDWTRFFRSRGFTGNYPGILDDRIEGLAAERLLDEARALLVRAQADRLLEIRAVCGFFPASSQGDDIVIWSDASRVAEQARIRSLRQDRAKTGGGLCLADWIAPLDSERSDWIGAFAISAGEGLEESLAVMSSLADDHDAGLLATLAERIVQAAAEKLHEDARKHYWGYASGEDLPKFRLLHGAYQGLRVSPGRAPCPDPRDRKPLLELLEAERRLGLRLDPAMHLIPAASVCGWYLCHPEARSFAVGKLSRAEALAYAVRRGEDLGETENWLRGELDYKPV